MDRPKHILIPTDYSDYSRVALEYALALAGTGEVRLTVIHVVELSSHRRGQRSVKEEQAASEAMREFLRGNSSVAGMNGVVRWGSPVGEIIRCAHEEGVDLIVVATHGRTGLAHALIGSVAEKIVRYSPVPVLSVKPQEISQKLLSENDVLQELHVSLSHETES
jgi:nucleotide-binding universal stress UspA family protein